jgi:hypothetical protein
MYFWKDAKKSPEGSGLRKYVHQIQSIDHPNEEVREQMKVSGNNPTQSILSNVASMEGSEAPFRLSQTQ